MSASRKAKVQNIWAPIQKNSRGQEWINFHFIRYTRRDSKAAFLEGISPKYAKELMRSTRFAKVCIEEWGVA